MVDLLATLLCRLASSLPASGGFRHAFSEEQECERTLRAAFAIPTLAMRTRVLELCISACDTERMTRAVFHATQAVSRPRTLPQDARDDLLVILNHAVSGTKAVRDACRVFRSEKTVAAHQYYVMGSAAYRVKKRKTSDWW